MKRLWRWARWGVLGLIVLCGAEALLLRHPGACFAWSAGDAGLTLHSDLPFTEEEARAVIAQARERLAASPYYGTGRHDAVFICNARWRRLLFFVGNYRAAGLNYMPLTRNVFLSGAQVAENRLVTPAGKVVQGEMTLSYFIAHEITHSLTHELLGAWDYQRLPSWLKEAYADYIARGSAFQRAEARAAYRSDASEVHTPAQAPYLRYNLLFGQLVEYEGRSPESIFASRISQADAEARLHAYLAVTPD